MSRFVGFLAKNLVSEYRKEFLQAFREKGKEGLGYMILVSFFDFTDPESVKNDPEINLLLSEIDQLGRKLKESYDRVSAKTEPFIEGDFERIAEDLALMLEADAQENPFTQREDITSALNQAMDNLIEEDDDEQEDPEKDDEEEFPEI